MEVATEKKSKISGIKFIVSSGSLLKRLQSVSGILSTNNAIPILDNFLFEIQKNQLTILASDLESSMSTQLHIEAKDKGKVAVPAKLLLDILKSFSEQPLTFTIDDKSFAIEISSDYGKYKLNGFDGEDFPAIPAAKDAQQIELTSESLANAINKTLFATGNDELRPVMSGVFCSFGKKTSTFVATDAHKLVRYRRADVTSAHEVSFVLPKKPLNQLKNLLNGSDDKVTLRYNTTHAFFSTGDAELACRLIDLKYPNYEAVIPTENPNKLTIDRMQFLSSVKRVSIFSNKTTYQIRLKITGSELNISAEDIDFNNEANERLSCNYNGEDMEIGFNARFLAEMLSNLESQEVRLEMSLPNRAGLLMPAEYSNKDEDILMLVMPVMLNN